MLDAVAIGWHRFAKLKLMNPPSIIFRHHFWGKYLEQIVSMLQKAGMVSSIRGSQGGYRLKRKPEEYSIGAILRVTEGDLALAVLINKISELLT